MIRGLGDIIQQFGQVGQTLGQMTNELNRLVTTSTRLVAGSESVYPRVHPRIRRQAQGNPFGVIQQLMGQLAKQASDLSTQITGLFGNFGRAVGNTRITDGGTPAAAGNAVESITGGAMNVMSNLQRALTG